MKKEIISQKIISQMTKSRALRIAITREDHLYFFYFYFSHYTQYEIAPFQQEFFYLTKRVDIKSLFIVAFRGSAKSTIFTLSYPLWAILGKKKLKFVLILCQTRNQAKQHMMNLRRELESNDFLKNDLGPFREERGEWGSSSLVFSNLNARITVASTEQSIRGIRHNQHRPQLIIADDVEDITSTKNKEGRDKTYQWLKSEVVPCGDRNTQLAVIGNLLHEDSLLMRLKRDIDEEIMDGIFKSYPLLDVNGNCLWGGKYSSKKEIDEERKRVGNEQAWQREFLLNIVPDVEQVVFREWVHPYNELPKDNNWKAFIAVDLAISQKSTADYTSIVAMIVYRGSDSFYGHILPNPINRRMGFPETIKSIKNQYDLINAIFNNTTILVEKVAYQDAVTQQLLNDGYPAEGVNIRGDKRSRLAITGNLIQNGKVLFPHKGAETLISQMVNFGTERYDDLVDAFTLAAQKLIDEGKPLHADDFIFFIE